MINTSHFQFLCPANRTDLCFSISFAPTIIPLYCLIFQNKIHSPQKLVRTGYNYPYCLAQLIHFSAHLAHQLISALIKNIIIIPQLTDAHQTLHCIRQLHIKAPVGNAGDHPLKDFSYMLCHILTFL